MNLSIALSCDSHNLFAKLGEKRVSKYEKHNLSMKTLPFIFMEAAEKRGSLHFAPSNWHENIELLCILEGSGSVSSNGHILSVARGDIVVLNHNHLHAVASADDGIRYRYLIVDHAFCVENGFDTNRIFFEMKIKDRRLFDLFEELYLAYGVEETEKYRTLDIRSIILSMMRILCHDYGTETAEDEDQGGALYIKRAIEYISASYAKDFSLEDVANFVGVSKYYLSREFNRYVGHTFVSYVNYVRCKKAKKLLAAEEFSISEIASLCGFRSSSYFAKSFEKQVGMLPGEYRASKSALPKDA